MGKAVAQSDNMFGDKLYQRRARKAFPILVRQAFSRQPIFYEALAAEVEMPNPRNLDYVLGSIGTTLNELSRELLWGAIPHIQSLVINQHDLIPGGGFDAFLAEKIKNYAKLSKEEKRAYLDGYWHEVFAYPYWNEILERCELKPTTEDVVGLVEKAKTGRSSGGGEGQEHRRLKNYIVSHPDALGLPKRSKGTTEAPLPSGDRMDILFIAKNRRVAVEVKSKISNNVDLTRGLFQCVKYRSVMEAERGLTAGSYAVDVLLAVGKEFPKNLRSLQNSLRVSVIELLDHY